MRIATGMDDGDWDDLDGRLERAKEEDAELRTRFIILAGTMKFGEPSPAVVERIRQSDQGTVLAAWLDRLETATSWGEWLNSM